jgi:large subunit ribosomal protein L19e
VKFFLNLSFSDQAEAHRLKNKAARERRAQRVAAKKDALLGVAPAAPAPVAADEKPKKK